MKAEMQEKLGKYNNLESEHSGAMQNLQHAFRKEKDALQKERDALQEERDALQKKNVTLEATLGALRTVKPAVPKQKQPDPISDNKIEGLNETIRSKDIEIAHLQEKIASLEEKIAGFEKNYLPSRCRRHQKKIGRDPLRYPKQFRGLPQTKENQE